MPKAAVQATICDICGADVREGSLFCYNCGGSLTPTVGKEAKAVSNQPAGSSNGASKGTIEQSRRSRPKRNLDRGPVEVVWQPREGFPLAFVVASAILLIVAGLLFFLAMWLK